MGFNGWNWDALSFSFPKKLALDIKATPLPFSSSYEDKFSWISFTNGEFKLKEAYRLLVRRGQKVTIILSMVLGCGKSFRFLRCSVSIGSVATKASQPELCLLQEVLTLTIFAHFAD